MAARTRVTKEEACEPYLDHPAFAGLELDAMERRFVLEIVKDFSLYDAGKRAGFPERGCKKAAHRMLNTPAVSTAVRRLAGQEIRERCITPKRVLDEIAKVCFSSIGDVVEVRNGTVTALDFDKLDADVVSAISEVSNVKDADGIVGMRVRMHDKIAALRLVAQCFGMLTDNLHVRDLTGQTKQVAHMTDEELEVIIANGGE